MTSSSKSSIPEVSPNHDVSSFGVDLADMLRNHVAHLLANGRSGIYHAVLLDVESVLVAAASKHCNGNKSQCAKALGITRTTFRARVRTINVCASLKQPGHK